MWSIEHDDGQPGRIAELHRLLSAKRTYQTHLDLSSCVIEEGRRKQREHWQEFKTHMTKVQEDLHEKAEEGRMKLQQEMRELRMRHSKSESGIARRLSHQNQEYMSWREDMEKRVSQMPPLCAGSPVTDERGAERRQEQKAIKERTRDYFKSIAELKERIATGERPLVSGGGGAPKSSELAMPMSVSRDVERKKTQGLKRLSQQHRDYEQFLEGIYESNNTKSESARKIMQREVREIKQTEKDRQLSASAKLAETTKAQTMEVEERRRVLAEKRPKGFAGYQPVAKGKRRVRNEAADQELRASILGGSCPSFGSFGHLPDLDSDLPTLSPRTLGLASGHLSRSDGLLETKSS